MNAETAKTLCRINNDFYRNHHAAFSKTRERPWQGWRRCLDVVKRDLLEEQPSYAGKRQGYAGEQPSYAEGRPSYAGERSSYAGERQDASEDGISYRKTQQSLVVFDIACGNLRFERFLESELPETSLTFYAVDNCDGIVPQMPNVTYQSLDILVELTEGHPLIGLLKSPACDLSVSFGFMHHIPFQEQRVEVLSTLIRQTRPGGLVIVSFWQFLNDEALSVKAQMTHERALSELRAQGILLDNLDEGDFLLGWENKPGAYRYCHSFSEAEIERLVESVADKAIVVSRFAADGRTGNLNTYLILRVL